MTLFSTSCEIPAVPSAVFAAIADPSRLARWWGPDGFTNTFEHFDFTPGGQWVFVMHGPDGKSYPNVSQFKVIDANHKVVISHECQPHFTLTITLQAQAAGTRVLWDQLFNDPAVAAAVAHIVEPANEQNLKRLTHEVTSHSL